MSIELKRAGGTAYREAIPETSEQGDPVLLIPGFPQSSYMWAPVLSALAASGRRAIAPDLTGYGDSPPDPPGTWERHVSALETFRQSLGLNRVVLGLHDWGGLIGLRWACDHPDAVSALPSSSSAADLPVSARENLAAARYKPFRIRRCAGGYDRYDHPCRRGR